MTACAATRQAVDIYEALKKSLESARPSEKVNRDRRKKVIT